MKWILQFQFSVNFFYNPVLRNKILSLNFQFIFWTYRHGGSDTFVSGFIKLIIYFPLISIAMKSKWSLFGHTAAALQSLSAIMMPPIMSCK